jgi:outer membrane lipoprotein-sorting protein
MKRNTILILLLNLGLPPVFAQSTSTPAPKPSASDELTPQTELVLKSLSERYEKLRLWKADFTHTNYSTALGTSKMSKGNFVFSYPNRFRFSLNGPSEISDFISDGKQAWYIRYPKSRTEPAQVQHLKDVSKLELDKYLILLRGLPRYSPESRKSLLKDFQISSRVDEKNLTLILEPRRSEDLLKVELSFEQLKEHPGGALITDSLGGESTISITDVTRLQKIAPDEFSPKYHKDSQVVVNP